jgi:hypothetical protein
MKRGRKKHAKTCGDFAPSVLPPKSAGSPGLSAPSASLSSSASSASFSSSSSLVKTARCDSCARIRDLEDKGGCIESMLDVRYVTNVVCALRPLRFRDLPRFQDRKGGVRAIRFRCCLCWYCPHGGGHVVALILAPDWIPRRPRRKEESAFDPVC